MTSSSSPNSFPERFSVDLIRSLEEEHSENSSHYREVDVDLDAALDRIINLAAHLFGSSMGMIALASNDELQIKAALGLEKENLQGRLKGLMARFCTRTLRSSGATIVSDATEEEQFADHLLVAGEPGLRFYAGVPLVGHSDRRIGTVCVMDVEPRTPSSEDISRLEDLAEMLVNELELSRQLDARDRAERRYEAIFNQTYQFTGLMRPDGLPVEANDTALDFGGVEREEVIGKPFWETYWWQTSEETKQQLREAIE